MLHLLLVLKLVTGNVNSWQTCDLRRTKKTNMLKQKKPHNRLRRMDDRDSLNQGKGNTYLYVWSRRMAGESALLFNR